MNLDEYERISTEFRRTNPSEDEVTAFLKLTKKELAVKSVSSTSHRERKLSETRQPSELYRRMSGGVPIC